MLKQTLLAASAFAMLGAAAHAAPAIGLVNGNQLFDFDTLAPGAATGLRNITGFAGGDTTLIGLDYRPSNAVLYGLGNGGTLYTVNQFTGVATSTTFTVPLGGSTADIAFNPAVDRLRTVGTAGANLRTNVDLGSTITDTPVSAASIVAVAYTNQTAGFVGSTTLYDIDGAGNLYVQVPPNNGALSLVGASGIAGITGFDIDGLNGNAAFASISDRLYSINLGTGAAALVGTFGGIGGVTDIAVVGVPEPMSLVVLSVGLFGLAAVRRRKA